MAETYRKAKVLKFLEKLREMKEMNIKYSQMYLMNLKELNRHMENDMFFLENVEEMEEILENLQFKKDAENIVLSTEQLMFFKEANNAITTIKDIDIILEESGEFFDLDIPERKVKSEMENYTIQPIDPMDMTGIKKQYYIMLGEIGVSYPDGTGDEEFVAAANKVFLEYVTHNDITKVDDGFIVSLPVYASHQVIKDLTNAELSVLAMIPIKEKE
ncbi:hypothetical protein [Bacillus thuringiensis]|uniref:Uncharacterized protein n=1 Tax=Bacillus thuringiensis subsp. jegathesan TaxID=56955 RepID=A0A9X6M8X2_BACTJ|nr:hypothetical protein [Bacillus thuringiensis]OUB62838.1 hypothetical protein BK750_20395 [Bacillus thuringiensis serovar jegathesan]OUB66403.1 hypothetical protein BK750_16205 [Bacillus thuringiensis serovar jegathesan]OUB66423.1 hypothetical protein BK750_16190 [Bacillus thuringiensis serovar jegathesan]OUB66432.1 hypothetical protein BK750_16180 [Bacillus thuringiensis serovar jegathesan]